MLNVDDSHFFQTRSLDEMKASGVDGLVDVYRDTAVRDLVFCVAGRRSLVDAEVPEWETAWSRPTADARQDNLHRNFSRLREQKIDPFDRWLDRCRRLGIGGWLSIRTNDDHHTQDVDRPDQPRFWRERPDLWRRPYHFERTVDRAFDFAKKEVGDRLLRLVRAAIDRYEMDGLEMDWMRRAWHFAPGLERKGAPLLTDLLKRIRDACKAGRRDIQLAVRVPPTPWDSFGFGLDAAEWARLGLVDRIAPCPNMSLFDDIPVELWKQMVQGTKVLICPGLAALVRPYLRKPHLKEGRRRAASPDVLRGIGAALYHRGGDQLHFFNLFDRSNSLGSGIYRDLLCQMSSADALRESPRRHVVTYNDSPAPGTPTYERLPIACGPCGNGNPWSDLAIPDTAELRVYTGAVSNSLRAEVRLAFTGATRKYGEHWAGVESIPAATSVRVNGCTCQFMGLAEVDEPSADEDMWAYAVPAGALNDGYNMIEALPVRSTSIEWAEIAFL